MHAQECIKQKVHAALHLLLLKSLMSLSSTHRMNHLHFLPLASISGEFMKSQIDTHTHPPTHALRWLLALGLSGRVCFLLLVMSLGANNKGDRRTNTGSREQTPTLHRHKLIVTAYSTLRPITSRLILIQVV